VPQSQPPKFIDTIDSQLSQLTELIAYWFRFYFRSRQWKFWVFVHSCRVCW